MASEATSAQKAQLFGILRYFGPLTTLIIAGVLSVVMKGEDFLMPIMGLLGVIAVTEFFLFGSLARKAERQAQRDRG